MKRLPLFVLLILPFISVAQLRVAGIFGDSMVLQRDRPIPVWGWAARNEKVSVTLNGKTKATKANAAGKWMVMLDALPAGGPFELNVQGSSLVKFKDVLIGDVWVCSGQSNMEWPLAASNRATEEIASANYPMIRHIAIVKDVAGLPKQDLMHPASWHPANPSNAGSFTAVGYFFARELYQQTQVPIGLLHTSWGGTDVETWTSREAFAADPEFKSMIASVPQLDIDSIASIRMKEMQQKLASFQPRMPTADEASRFSDMAVDDASWRSLPLPGLWETTGLPDLDGYVWFRKSITIRAADGGKAGVLKLGMIDDNDETWINGERIGNTNGYNEPREYKVKEGILKEGNNVIAVRVHDTGGGGGIYGESNSLSLVVAGNSYPLAGDWKVQIESIQQGGSSVNPNSYPTLLYNAMIHPLVPFGIKGAIWYQGENNAGRAVQYRKAFPLMINDWRRHWNQGDFPFYFVQLASFNPDGGNVIKGSDWAELREAQAMTLSLPNTGMAVTTDIGESHDIHPRNKQDVGKRLAAIALNKDYGKQIEYSGPVYKSMAVEGNKVIISFDHAGKGLEVRDRYGYIKGFAIAGSDQQFRYAKASVDGDKVVVYADGVDQPVAVRYSWENDAADSNLYNKEGFPAAPFRTDNWKAVTEGKRYRD